MTHTYCRPPKIITFPKLKCQIAYHYTGDHYMWSEVSSSLMTKLTVKMISFLDDLEDWCTCGYKSDYF